MRVWLTWDLTGDRDRFPAAECRRLLETDPVGTRKWTLGDDAVGPKDTGLVSVLQLSDLFPATSRMAVRIGIKSDPRLVHDVCSEIKGEKVFLIKHDGLSHTIYTGNK